MKYEWMNDYIVHKEDSIYYAHWKLYRNKSLLVVVDDQDLFEGIVTISEFNKTFTNESLLKVGDIFNAKCKYIMSEAEDVDVITKARDIFADFAAVKHIPVIDRERNLIDVVSREQAFWKQYFDQGKLPRMYYAFCMYMAALEAKTLGYPKISVMEFGVAGGNGLINCEFHAKAITRLLGVEIEIYGFDSGVGLPAGNMGYKDMIHLFRGGDYKMDADMLKKHLECAKLILGDFRDTTKNFFEEYHPAPVGCMLIDVDYYSSTLPILEFLKNDNKYFIPRIYTYWDDISPEYEFQGENLAIREFNQSNTDLKISPERESYQNHRKKTKICHRFSHEKYNENSEVYVGIGTLRHEAPVMFHELPLQANHL